MPIGVQLIGIRSILVIVMQQTTDHELLDDIYYVPMVTILFIISVVLVIIYYPISTLLDVLVSPYPSSVNNEWCFDE